MSWEAVIGLEIHAQLTTKSKLFCHCSAEFGAGPNEHVCPVCTGMPGVLPFLNKQVVDYAIKLGLATHCSINAHNEFARKNYFYPDLPKGYQISQFDKPICLSGYMDVAPEGKTRRIGITRIHMEEDAGKLVHQGSDNIKGATHSFVDLNRSSVPLLEIVSEPDIRTAAEAVVYMEQMRSILRYLEICDGNMEEGSMRCDANISIRPKGQTELGTKTEVKNLNSFKAVEKAIKLEIQRQIDVLEEGGTIVQETRHYNEATNSTKSLRSKEEAHDYRYFPDPDLVPLVIDESWIDAVRQTMPELPEARKLRYKEQYQLSDYDAGVLTAEKAVSDFFEKTVALCKKAKEAANWIMGDITGYLNSNHMELSETKLTPEILAEMIDLIAAGTISGKIAKDILPELLKEGDSPKALVEKKGLAQVSDTGAIKSVVESVLAANPESVASIKAGKVQAMGFLVGQVMKQTQGKANPALVNQLLKELIGC